MSDKNHQRSKFYQALPILVGLIMVFGFMTRIADDAGYDTIKRIAEVGTFVPLMAIAVKCIFSLPTK